MTTYIEPISVVTDRAKNVLVKEIGIFDTIRFLNQFRAGIGNYTEEREQLYKDMTVKEIIREIKMKRRKTTIK